MAIEIVDIPMKSMVISHSYVKVYQMVVGLQHRTVQFETNSAIGLRNLAEIGVNCWLVVPKRC